MPFDSREYVVRFRQIQPVGGGGGLSADSSINEVSALSADSTPVGGGYCPLSANSIQPVGGAYVCKLRLVVKFAHWQRTLLIFPLR